MKLSVAFQFAGAALVLAQAKDCTSVALAAIPSCAQPCYLENAPSIGCGGLDFACQCKQKTAMFNAIQGCVASKCAASEFEKVIDGSNEVCDCAAPGFIESATPTTTAAPSTMKTVQTVQTVQTAIPSSIQSAIAAPTSGNGNYDYPPRPSPTYFSHSSGAERSVSLGLGVVFSVFLAVMVL